MILQLSAYDLCIVPPSKVVYGICDIQTKSVPISVLRVYPMVLIVKNVLFALRKVIAKHWDFGLNIKMYWIKSKI